MKINFQKIKIFIKKLPRILGEHAFFTFLGFIVIAAALGGFMFYKYSMMAERKLPEITETPIRFNEKLYEELLETWREREEKFQKADFNAYSNPFLEPSPIPVTEEELTE